MDDEMIIRDALSRFRRFGYSLNVIMIIVGIIGWVYWKWYALPVAILSGIIIGYIYSAFFYSTLSKNTGYDKFTLKLMLKETDDNLKQKRSLNATELGSKEDNYQILRQLIYEDKVLLLPHKRYQGSDQISVYSKCGTSLEFFENAYLNGDVILQFGKTGARIGHPIPWEEALADYLNGDI